VFPFSGCEVIEVGAFYGTQQSRCPPHLRTETYPVPKHRVFYESYLEFRTMDKAQKSIDSECFTPLSEPFRKYEYIHIKKEVSFPHPVL
jgi:hypothetical protein